MRRGAWVWVLAALMGGAAAASCSAILGLEPPPPPADGGTTGTGGAPEVTCAPLDAGLAPDARVEAGTYEPFGPATATGGDWDWFEVSALGQGAPSFYGGTFDGRYVYFAGRGLTQAQYDTQGTSGFGDPSSWSTFNVSKAHPSIPGYFSGAVYDGTYVYFVPNQHGTAPESVVARYDPSAGAFNDAAAWSSFDVKGMNDPSADAGGGFFGGSFDGRYVYLVPHFDGVADGRLVRFDTTADAGRPLDAGATLDGGDAGAAVGPPFDNPANWSAFDVGTVSPLAVGFSGAVYDGRSLLLVPQTNLAFGDAVHGGASSTVARFQTNAGFDASSAWSTYDLSNVSGNGYDFIGAGFDGRYVYLAPRTLGVALRFDTAAPLGAPSSWSAYDLYRQFAPDAATPEVAGAAFDGRFVYFMPSGSNTPVLRYDTLSPFAADCAWSTADLSGVSIDGGVPGAFGGAVFDGQYLYLIPNGSPLFGRYRARAPASLPALPAFHGSFW